MSKCAEFVWFDPVYGTPPSEASRRHWCSLDSESNPFHAYIGNEEAVKRLMRTAYMAFGRYNRCCSDQNFAVYGPASSGKTTLLKLFAKLVDLPFVEIDPTSISTVRDVLLAISAVCESTERGDVTLELQQDEFGRLIAPPMIVFMDEADTLPKAVVRGLLKATEKNDGMMTTEDGWVMDCRNIMWGIATTERGLMFDALDSRFTKITLNLYSGLEIAQIVQLKYPNWSNTALAMVAKYASNLPREALAFAKEMELEANMQFGRFNLTSQQWTEIAKTVAADNNIDEFGMSKQRFNVLEALYHQGSISRARMQDVAGCKEEELTRYVMPALLAKTADRLPLVTTSSRGYVLTQAGEAEVEKRGIRRRESINRIKGQNPDLN